MAAPTRLVLNSIRREAVHGPFAGAREAFGWGVALLGAIALAASVVEASIVLMLQSTSRRLSPAA